MTAAIDQSEPRFAESSEEITALIRRLTDDAQKDFLVDRRREHRYPLLVPVVVTPVGGPGFTAVTRDISRRGISFLHTTTIDDHYVYLQFPELLETPAIVVEVLRRRQVGPLWEIAGAFRARPRRAAADA
jgi:hypothetical protein